MGCLFTTLAIFIVIGLIASLMSFAFSLTFGLIALIIKALPIIVLIVIVLFFVQGGKISHTEHGFDFHFPPSWHR